MWFDGVKCREGLSMLSNYKKKWNNQIGGFTSIAVHDDASHGSDAMRYLCSGLGKIDSKKDTKEDLKALRAYWGGN
jgi:hypothetical protein